MAFSHTLPLGLPCLASTMSSFCMKPTTQNFIYSKTPYHIHSLIELTSSWVWHFCPEGSLEVFHLLIEFGGAQANIKFHTLGVFFELINNEMTAQ